jgi:hypothetical protein
VPSGFSDIFILLINKLELLEGFFGERFQQDFLQSAIQIAWNILWDGEKPNAKQRKAQTGAIQTEAVIQAALLSLFQ